MVSGKKLTRGERYCAMPQAPTLRWPCLLERMSTQILKERRGFDG